jgi:hypothetical protein
VSKLVIESTIYICNIRIGAFATRGHAVLCYISSFAKMMPTAASKQWFKILGVGLQLKCKTFKLEY